MTNEMSFLVFIEFKQMMSIEILLNENFRFLYSITFSIVQIL